MAERPPSSSLPCTEDNEAAPSSSQEIASYAIAPKSLSPAQENGASRRSDSNADPKEQHAGKSSRKAPQSVPYYKLYAFANGFDIAMMVIGTIGGVGNGAAMPVMTLLFGSLIDAFGKNSSNVDSIVHEVSKVALRFVYLGAGAAVASFAQLTCWMVTGERQASRIRRFYLRAILRQEIGFFDKETSTGEVVGRMSGDTVLIQEAMGEKAGRFLQLVSTFVGGFIVAFVRGWKLTLVMLSVIPLLVGAGGTMAFVITKATSNRQEAYAEAGDIVEQAIGAIRTVVSFTGERKTIEDYRKALKRAYRSFIQQGLASGFGVGSVFVVMFSAYSLAFWYGAKLIINEGYTGGRIINVILSILMGAMSLGQASPSINAFAAGKAAAWKMFEVINRVPLIDVSRMDGSVFNNMQGDIKFMNVDFAYPARPDVRIFCKFSLHIPKGITAALVGESGSGKSTVISLIERFYDPQSGKVMLDDTDIRHLQLKWLRKQIGLVSQEPVLFGTSIKENILYGKDGSTFDEVKSAAELANAAKFINSMPQGYDTLVGEHGTQLSGGQKQRIAIARAILKNPHILLLDEATSALDAESERLVQEALDRVMMNRTTLVVAHRLTTIRNADLIAVLQNGAIVETGKHEELIQMTNGAYFQLVRLQQIYQGKQEQASEGALGSSMSLSVGSQHIFGRTSSSRSLRRSINSSFGGSKRSSSDNERAAAIMEIQISKKKSALFQWFCTRTRHDLETGENNISTNVSIFRLASLNKPEAPIFVLGTFAAMLNGVIFPVFGLLLSSMIKTFYESPHKLRKDANFWASMFVILAASCFIIMPTQMVCFAIGGARLIQRVRLLAFEKLLQQEIAWFDETENSSGALGARLSTDAAHIKSLVGDALALIVQNIATIVAGLVIAFTASWQMALVVLAVVPLLGLQGIMQLRFIQGFSADAKVMYEEASQVASDAVSSIRTVASYGAEEKVLNLYTEKCSVPLKSGIKQGLVSGMAIAFSNLMMFSTYGLCFWFGSKLVHQEKATFKDIFRVFFAVTMSAMSVTQSTGLAPDLANVKTAVNSVFGLLDRKSKIDTSDTSGKILESVNGNIEFKHVSFKYPTRPDIQIFKDLSLQVHAGMTFALVGESGSGKSTVIALVERFYDPDSGHILLDRVDIKKLQLKWLRQQMGLVSQEPVLFNDTIRANIAYGKEGVVSIEQVIAAAEASNAHKFISSFPEGYNTRVGERGVQLSGGQKQRVAIARAILKNPKILLLDEATSALDAESEHIVQEALDKVMVGRTTIVIAHRLSTIKNADKIAVVKDGSIIEEGRHDELISIKNGAYASLVKLHMSST